VDVKYEVGQLVEGVVTKVVRFGAFVEIESGLEGLLHVSEFAEIAPRDPRDLVQEGDHLLVRIIRVESWRRRMGLSLRQVSEAEWEAWVARSEGLAQQKEKAEVAEGVQTDATERAGEDAGDHMEEEPPSGQWVEWPAPVGEGLWASFVEEG
jgi:small subunit ribosomal protein S1